jgi:hypothetical protein
MLRVAPQRVACLASLRSFRLSRFSALLRNASLASRRCGRFVSRVARDSTPSAPLGFCVTLLSRVRSAWWGRLASLGSGRASILSIHKYLRA